MDRVKLSIDLINLYLVEPESGLETHSEVRLFLIPTIRNEDHYNQLKKEVTMAKKKKAKQEEEEEVTS